MFTSTDVSIPKCHCLATRWHRPPAFVPENSSTFQTLLSLPPDGHCYLPTFYILLVPGTSCTCTNLTHTYLFINTYILCMLAYFLKFLLIICLSKKDFLLNTNVYIILEQGFSTLGSRPHLGSPSDFRGVARLSTNLFEK